MRKSVLLVVAVIIQYIGVPVHAVDLKYSGRTEIWDNPFIAYGYNPRAKITTGYLAALRTAPGRTDECKLVFAGNADKKNKFFVRYLEKEKPSDRSSRPRHHVSVVGEHDVAYLKFSRKSLGGDCDWILPFVMASDSLENADEVMVEMEAQHAGDWISVYVIGVLRARFHSRPDTSSVQNTFLVKGDVIYVYDERPEWYFVKYEEGKRKTEGWIRKSDTLQP